MAEVKGEIEQFLLDKLQAGIDRKVPYSSKFSRRKKLLETQLKSAKEEKKTEKVREKLYLLNSLMDQSNSIFDYFSWHLFSGLHRIKKEMQSVAKNDAAAGGDGDRPPATAAAMVSTRTIAPKKVLGLHADELVLQNMVTYSICDNVNCVGIVGTEGVGKTTLARLIFDKQEVDNRFLPRIWISLSEHPIDVKGSLKVAIAERTLLALGVADEVIGWIRQSAAKDAEIRNAADQASEEKAVEDTERAILAALIYAIRQELMGKTYLIVLDGASETEEWYRDLSLEPTAERNWEEKLGFAFPKGSGGTVLVTGRTQNVVKGMVGGDGSAIHRLLPLEEQELCWDIYKEATEEMKKADEKEEEVKEEVLKRSNGLPYAARLMGEISKKKNSQTSMTGGDTNNS